jgi:REP-associated tyrosine transposase
MSRGNNKDGIFTEIRDHETYLTLLAEALERFSVRCHAFCLMWTHVHLLLTPTDCPISRMMQQLNSAYCQRFNARHKRVGHVLQGRYTSVLVEGASYFLRALRYISMNPVVGRKVTHPGDWPWSSYTAHAGLAPVPPWLYLPDVWHALDATCASEAHERFTAFVSAGDGSEDLWGPLIMGSPAFARKVDRLLEPHRANHEFTYAQRFATRPSLSVLLVGRLCGPDLDSAVRDAFCRHAYTLREIGAALNLHPATVWTWVQRADFNRPN